MLHFHSSLSEWQARVDQRHRCGIFYTALLEIGGKLLWENTIRTFTERGRKQSNKQILYIDTRNQEAHLDTLLEPITLFESKSTLEKAILMPQCTR